MFGFDNSTRKSITIAGILHPCAFPSLLEGKSPFVLKIDSRSRIKCYCLNHGVLFAKAMSGIVGQVSTGLRKF